MTCQMNGSFCAESKNIEIPPGQIGKKTNKQIKTSNCRH